MNNNVPFNFDLTNVNVNPYLHTENKYRVRFDFENINEFIINFIIEQCKKEENFKILYLVATSVNGFSQESLNLKTKEFLNSYKYNHEYEEKKISFIEDNDLIEFTFFEIKGMNKTHIYHYYLYMQTRNAEDNYLYFYNDHSIIYMTSDVLDIVSNNEFFIKEIKNTIISYDKYHE